MGSILAMPPNHATELRKLLGEIHDGKGVGLSSAAFKEARAEIQAQFKAGLYGNFDEYYTEEILDEEGNPTAKKERKSVNNERYQQALANRLRMEAELVRFIQQNPRATAIEINDHIRAYQSEIMVSSIRDQFGSAIGAAAQAAGITPPNTGTEKRPPSLWTPNLLTTAIGTRAGVY